MDTVDSTHQSIVFTVPMNCDRRTEIVDLVYKWSEEALRGRRGNLVLCGASSSYVNQPNDSVGASGRAFRNGSNNPFSSLGLCLTVGQLVREYKAFWIKDGGVDLPRYPIPSETGTRLVKYDEYVRCLACRSLLSFIGFGHGESRGLYRDTIQQLLEPRAKAALPTLFTSIYSIEGLRGRLGNQIVSLMVKNGYEEVSLLEA